MPNNISSRKVKKKEPKRDYLCPRCDAVFSLHPGMHWHDCNGHEWRMDEVGAWSPNEIHSLISGMISRNRPKC